MQLIDTALQIGVFAIPALFAHLLIRSTIAAWSQPRQQEEVQTIALNDGLESFTTDDDRLLQIWEQTPDHDNFIVEAAIPAGEFRYATAEEAAIVETGMVAIAAYWQSRPVHNVVPFIRKSATVAEISASWSDMTTPQLRKACTDRGIRWNRANGGKHATKAQMVAWLEEVAIAS